MTEFVSVGDLDDSNLLEAKSALRDVEVFTNSMLHQDFINWIDLRLEMITTLLDDEGLVYTGRDYDKFRGGKKAFKEMKGFFVDLSEAMKEVNE